jgi:N-acetylmuramoyl-L-alanine amidase
MIAMRRLRWLSLCCFVLACVLGVSLLAPPARAAGDTLQNAFAQAAQEFGVPPSVLLAVSYNESRWETHHGQPSTAGGYGPMHLVDLSNARLDDARGDGSVHMLKPNPNDPAQQTLATAAALLGVKPDVLKNDAAQNIRGGAALLAQYARDTVGGTPADPARWYGAVVKYSASSDPEAAFSFADDVYATIQQGAARTTSDGQQVTLAASPVQPDIHSADRLPQPDKHHRPADCPQGLDCRFIPAAYHLNNPNDLGDYGNYDLARRPSDGLDIEYIVIHDTETSYNDAIALFQNPLAYVSAHYVLRSSDGQVTQMVQNKNVAWQAGNWYVNMHSIGIEHEGFAVEGATWYTERLYHASARLVRYLAGKYDVPLDRAHIIGHDNVPGPTAAYQAGMHWDPGPFWDWAHYMTLIGAPITPQGDADDNIVTINPNWATNMPPLTYCDPTCHDLPPQPANFVYLHTAPSDSAPLLDDPALPGPGTTEANDWGDKAVVGQQFYRAARQGDWDGIYFSGQLAWFYNPHHNTNTVRGKGTLVTPKAGLDAIPVYGRAYPEASAYPAGISPQAIVPLQYTIPAGQIYVAKDRVRADYYYAPTYTLNPADHTVVEGQTQYYEIFFNHRISYLMASDVRVVDR